jgi:hypothetical protein
MPDFCSYSLAFSSSSAEPTKCASAGQLSQIQVVGSVLSRLWVPSTIRRPWIGCSHYIINRDVQESVSEGDREITLERTKELHLEAPPRIISDNVLNAGSIFEFDRRATLHVARA